MSGRGGPTTGDLLDGLERDVSVYGAGAADRKLAALDGLEGRSFRSATDLLRFHEALCFLRAYPDDLRVRRRVDRLLRGFRRRRDVRRLRRSLRNTGVAGAEIRFRFFWPTARWLVHRWPRRLTVDWPEFVHRERLPEILPVILPYCETLGLDEVANTGREWVDLLRGPEETDAAFLVRRFEALRADTFGRERLYDTLDPPLRLEPGADLPGRGEEEYRKAPRRFQKGPLIRTRPDLSRDLQVPPGSVDRVRGGGARELIDLARLAMINRSRDLDAFAYADPEDVRLVDCGDGLAFACYGLLPERRLLLESSYGFLTLKNGVPVGYVLVSALFESAAIAYNIFDTFRGGEAARTYGRVLAMAHHLFGARSFSVDPFQLGHGNPEGLESGAWWFYYKLGFRPVDPDVQKVLRAELRAMRRDPRHRSSQKTLRKLVVDDLYFHLGRERREVLGRIPIGRIGLAISRYLAGRFGSARERGIRTCTAEAAALLGAGPLRRLPRRERLAWERWSPLIRALPGVESWTAAERSAAAAVIFAKGARQESDFVRRFDGHRRLRGAVLRLSRTNGPG